MRLTTRTWLALALAALLSVPTAAGLLMYRLLPVLTPDGSRERLIIEVDRSTDRWADPQWQRELRSKMESVQLDTVLLDGSGRELLRTQPADGTGLPIGTRERPLSYWTHRNIVGGEVWVAHYYGPPNPESGASSLIPDHLLALLPVVTALLALILTLIWLSWFIQRALLQPLAAMGQAARHVAAGELAFRLPDTRVREVSEVAAAFTAMGEALRSSLQSQAALEQERRLFIGAIAHDLRTPLFTLRGFLDGLEQGLATTPEKAASYIAICRDKAEQLSRLVSDLFEFSRLEYLEQAPHREAVDLGRLLHRIAGAARDTAQAKGITLLVAGEDDATPTLADAQMLTRAIENLIDNALRHTPSGGQIELRWQRLHSHIVVRLSDTGPGIDPTDLPHLFEPLYRGENSRNRRTGGAGLGLTIARRIVRAHGGDLTASNAPAGGAEFTVTVPVTLA